MIQEVINWLLFTVIGMNPQTKISEIISYFLYDSIKILLLLFLLITAIGILRTYIPQKKIMRVLGGKRKWLSHLSASVFGAITPFCSCSSIPIFFGFLKSGVPLGPAFSFLITSPIVNEYLFVLMLGFFGWKIALLYAIAGILIGFIVGIILGNMKLEKYLERDITGSQKISNKIFKKFSQRIAFGLNEAKDILKKVWLWVLIGVTVGAIIHNFIPEQAIHTIINKTGFLTVPLAVLIGVPLYGSCAAIVPIAVVLFQKGVPLGTALAFMMAVSALSLPEAVILRRAMKLKLIVIFFGVVALAIVIIGYLFNVLQQVIVS